LGSYVPFHIIGEFPFPELDVAFGGSSGSAARMPVPETAMDENHASSSRENDIRLTRQISPVKPEPDAESV